MPRHSPRLRKLERLLLDLPDDGGPMLVSELDGYLAGLLVCPDLVVPSQWLPQVWSRDEDEGGQPVFEDMGHVQATIGAVMEHYNAIAKGLAAARPTYAPVLDEDPRSDEILWELWADGFGRAVDLKPSSWAAIDTSGDEEARVALAGLLQLVAIARDEGTLSSEAIHAFDDTAPDPASSLADRRFSRTAILYVPERGLPSEERDRMHEMGRKVGSVCARRTIRGQTLSPVHDDRSIFEARVRAVAERRGYLDPYSTEGMRDFDGSDSLALEYRSHFIEGVEEGICEFFDDQ